MTGLPFDRNAGRDKGVDVSVDCADRDFQRLRDIARQQKPTVPEELENLEQSIRPSHSADGDLKLTMNQLGARTADALQERLHRLRLRDRGGCCSGGFQGGRCAGTRPVQSPQLGSLEPANTLVQYAP